MVELARQAAVEELAITWGVESDNAAAQRFYRRPRRKPANQSRRGLDTRPVLDHLHA
jgi:ribosomal protein S18 acetylase RimI-like enzyme